MLWCCGVEVCWCCGVLVVLVILVGLEVLVVLITLVARVVFIGFVVLVQKGSRMVRWRFTSSHGRSKCSSVQWIREDTLQLF